jgi:hypothetical protein
MQSAPVLRGLGRYEANAVKQSGCNVFTCGALVITCATACLSGVGTAACIACLGSAYDSCKDCF